MKISIQKISIQKNSIQKISIKKNFLTSPVVQTSWLQQVKKRDVYLLKIHKKKITRTSHSKKRAWKLSRRQLISIQCDWLAKHSLFRFYFFKQKIDVQELNASVHIFIKIFFNNIF